jgi:RNA polymerase sigma-70 factor (ECF subfamily)
MDRAAVNSLMKEASSGDGHAYAALASMVQDELFRFAIAQGLDHTNAADATQEVLMRAYARLSVWKPGSDALAWLCGITLNVVRETKRKELRQKRSWMAQNEWQGDQTTESEREQRPDAEELGQLMEAVAELPPRQREAVACRYLRRMTVRETAEVMGCAEGTVKSAVSAALERLRDKLQPTKASDPGRTFDG